MKSSSLGFAKWSFWSNWKYKEGLLIIMDPIIEITEVFKINNSINVSTRFIIDNERFNPA
jgi:hypothetical protein